MEMKNILNIFFPFSLFKLIFLFKIIDLISSKLDNIIKIGTDNYRFVRFSLSSKGDMIVDSSAFPQYGNENEYQKKNIFWLKKKWKILF